MVESGAQGTGAGGSNTRERILEAALVAYRALEQRQGWEALEVVETTTEPGPVFLKANQKGESIRIRIEHGLGQGLLITGHDDADGQPSTTWGPLPLNFFSLPNA